MNKQNKYNILIFFCTIIFFYACQSTSVHANQVQIIESAAPVKYLSNSSQKVADTSLNSKDSAPSEHNGATDEKTVLPNQIEKSSEEPIITLIKKYFDSSNATDIFSIFHLTKKVLQIS